MARITSARLRQILSYDPDTGVFVWLDPGSNHQNKIGKRAGTIYGKQPAHQYRRIGIGGQIYLASHLAWLYVHRQWPSNGMIHINKDGLDDSIANLKPKTLGGAIE